MNAGMSDASDSRGMEIDDSNVYFEKSSSDYDIAFYKHRFERDASRLFDRGREFMISYALPLGKDGSPSGKYAYISSYSHRDLH